MESQTAYLTISKMIYGQVVLGPPGSGKSTYCATLKKYLTESGRKCIIVNLDPANETLQYECEIDITELVSLIEVMNEYKLGPNGGLLFCMEFLLKNLDWLYSRLEEFQGHYVLFDFPGQVELFTTNDSIKSIIQSMEKHNLRLVLVNLVDSFYCSNPEVFISACLTSLITMLNLELPAINVLSKIDLMTKYGEVDFDLDYYTELPEITQMLFCVDRKNRARTAQGEEVEESSSSDNDDDDENDEKDENDNENGTNAGYMCDEEIFVNRPKDQFQKQYRKLYWGLCELIDDFGLLSYLPLDIQSTTSIEKIVNVADKANGFSLYEYTNTSSYPANPELQVYSKEDVKYYDMVAEMNDKYVKGGEEEEFNYDDYI